MAVAVPNADIPLGMPFAIADPRPDGSIGICAFVGGGNPKQPPAFDMLVSSPAGTVMPGRLPIFARGSIFAKSNPGMRPPPGGPALEESPPQPRKGAFALASPSPGNAPRPGSESPGKAPRPGAGELPASAGRPGRESPGAFIPARPGGGVPPTAPNPGSASPGALKSPSFGRPGKPPGKPSRPGAGKPGRPSAGKPGAAAPGKPGNLGNPGKPPPTMLLSVSNGEAPSPGPGCVRGRFGITVWSRLKRVPARFLSESEHTTPSLRL